MTSLSKRDAFQGDVTESGMFNQEGILTAILHADS